MRIIKSSNVNFLTKFHYLNGRHQITIGQMALYKFSDSGNGDLLDESSFWNFLDKNFSNFPIDEGYPKPFSEFNIISSVFSDGGDSVRELLISARIGSLNKKLLVTGDRFFNENGSVSNPVSFSSMNLSDLDCHGKKEDELSGNRLPNLEYIDRRINSSKDALPYIGFSGDWVNSRQRIKYLGEVGDDWIKKSWPYLPEGTRSEYFMTTSPDQWFDGYLKGDESFEIFGMHPREKVVQGRLPGLRARCFINKKNSNGSIQFLELATNLDTAWFFPDQECGIVLYRAQAEVADIDADDVLHLMGEWEYLDDAPNNYDYYLEKFKQEIPENQVLKENSLGEAEKLSATNLEVPASTQLLTEAASIPASFLHEENFPELKEVHDLVAQLEDETQELMKKHGLTQADIEKYLPKEESMPAVSQQEVDKLIEELKEKNDALIAQHGITQQEIESFMPVEEENENPSSLQEVKALLEELDATNQKLMQQNGLTDEDVQQILASKPELADAYQALYGPDAKRISISDYLTKNESKNYFSTSTVPAIGTPIATQSPSLSQPQLSREQVLERYAAKASLAGFDLSGVDLSNLNLDGVDLSGSLLTGASLAGSQLSQANLEGCLLNGADCSGADFSQANLSGVSAAGSVFTKTNMVSARLTDTDFSGANFSGVNLRTAIMDGATFERAEMSGVQAAGARAAQGNFSGADLRAANFAQANLSQAMLNECQLEGANFHAADCAHAEFYGVQAQRAQFANARLDASRADASSHFTNSVFECASLRRAAWDGACLDGAMLAGAMLDDADLSNVQARGTSFQQASARQAKFGGAHLARADFQGANLFKASLRKAKLDDAVLHFANAFGADFEATDVKAAALQGTDIGQTILQFRPPKA